MRLLCVVLLSGLAGAASFGVLLAIFGAIARFAAFHRGCTPENQPTHAFANGAGSGFRFGLFVGLVVGSLCGYVAGPENFGFGVLAQWLFVGVGLIVLAVFFGWLAWRSEKSWTTEKSYEALAMSAFAAVDLRDVLDQSIQPRESIVPAWRVTRSHPPTRTKLGRNVDSLESDPRRGPT